MWRQVTRDVQDLLQGVPLVQGQGARLVLGGGHRALAILRYSPARSLAESPENRSRQSNELLLCLPPLDIGSLHVSHVGAVVGESNERIRGHFRQFALN